MIASKLYSTILMEINIEEFLQVYNLLPGGFKLCVYNSITRIQ